MKKYTAIGVSIIIFSGLVLSGFIAPIAHAQGAPISTDNPFGNTTGGFGGDSGFGFTDSGGGDEGIVACEGADDCDFDKLVETMKNIVDFLIVLATSIATIIIAWAGFLYLTAAGNTSKISQAHNLIWMAVVGFLIALSAGLIVDVIIDSLGAEKIETW